MTHFLLRVAALLPDNEFAGSSRLRLWWILGSVAVDAVAEPYKV